MKPQYFITAYEIAVKRGFHGTEEEWLASLTAYYLAQQAGYQGTADEWIAVLNDPVPHIQIGEVTTLPGGSEATASLSGDKRYPKLNLGIPRGIGMVDALALIGGQMKGNIDMNGFFIGNLPTPKEDGHAVNKEYVDKRLKKDGSEKMEGNLDMAGHAVRNLSDPTEDDEATCKGYVDKRLKKDGSEKMEGSLDMGGHCIKNLLDPVQESDAVPKSYVMTKAFSMALLASGWSDAAPYTQSVEIGELNDDRKVRVYPAWPEDLEEKLALSHETEKVRSSHRNGKVLTFECWEEKPELDISVIVEVSV